MTRAIRLTLAVALCTGCTTAIRVPHDAGPPRPERVNVLLIVVDDLRHDVVGPEGTAVHTPNIDALAARGTRFELAFAQSTVCNPSRASMLTGLRPDATGVHSNQAHLLETRPDAVTLPALFRRNGYRTVRLGKIYHTRERLEHPDDWDEVRYGKPTRLGQEGEGRLLSGERWPQFRWLAANGTDEDQPDGQIARWAADFLARPPEEPFFLAVGFYKPHDPWVAPKRYFDLYPLDSITLHRDPDGMSPTPADALGGPWAPAFAEFTDRERRDFVRAYFATTSFVDAQVGKLLDALERHGHANDTVVVFVSDHGLHLGERGWWHKNTLYDVSARAPLAIVPPGRGGAGGTSAAIVELIDIVPTLADLAGLDAPEGVHGRSLVPLLDDPVRPFKAAAFTQLRRRDRFGRSVRTERWRYIEWEDDAARRELFDHRADPGEFFDLAGDPEHAEVVARLSGMIDTIRENPAAAPMLSAP